MKLFTSLFAALSLLVLALMAALPSTAALAGGGDCISYNPSAVYTVAEGDHYLLTDGTKRLEVLDNATDASSALSLAQLYTRQCFVGRDNTRPDRLTYITEYWALPSNMLVPSFAEDCISFNPSNLSIAHSGSDWIVKSGSNHLSKFASQQAAQVMVNIIEGNHWNQQCFIGRNNTRADHLAYVVEYWKAPRHAGTVTPVVLQKSNP